MSKVHQLKVGGGMRPNPRVIQILHGVLKEAEQGRVQGVGVALACVSEPDDKCERVSESVIAYSDGWAHSTSAAISGLWMRMHYERYIQGHVVKSDDEEKR